MKIVILGGMSSLQFYRQTTQEWLPDHTVAPVIDAHGQQTDGTLRLKAEYTIYDVDENLDVQSIVPQIYWYINDTQVTTTDTTADYYLVGDLLYVRKNFTHQNGVKVYCECRFVDTRTSAPQIMSDTLSLSSTSSVTVPVSTSRCLLLPPSILSRLKHDWVVWIRRLRWHGSGTTR